MRFIRRILHALRLPVSKFSTMQERFDDVDQFMADYRAGRTR